MTFCLNRDAQDGAENDLLFEQGCTGWTGSWEFFAGIPGEPEVDPEIEFHPAYPVTFVVVRVIQNRSLPCKRKLRPIPQPLLTNPPRIGPIRILPITSHGNRIPYMMFQDDQRHLYANVVRRTLGLATRPEQFPPHAVKFLRMYFKRFARLAGHAVEYDGKVGRCITTRHPQIPAPRANVLQ
jgi:hypothetical protein